MVIEVVAFFISLLLTAITGYVLLTMARNYKAHKFFKLKSPNLPVLPNPSLFDGHNSRTWFNKRNWQVFERMHQKYGLTCGWFYCNKPAVSTIDLDLIKAMVLDRKYDHIDRLFLNIPITEVEVDSIFFAKKDQWRRLRKATAPALTNHKFKMPNVQAELEEVIGKFVESIEVRLKKATEQRGEKFIVEDLDDIFMRYTLALVFKCFYKQDEIINFHSDKDYWVELIDWNCRTIINPFLRLCVMFPIIKPVIEWLIVNFHPQGLLRRNLMKFIKQQTKLNLDARKERNEARQQDKTGNFNADNFVLKDGSKFRRNLIDSVIDYYHDGKLTHNEFFNTTFFFFFASVKTSADSLSRLIYQLACHPKIQSKLRESILAESTESEYLHWTLNESIRLFPSVPIGCSRVITSDIQSKVGLIPAGTHVFTPTFIIHKLTEYWGQDADEFRPERWSDAENFHPCQFLAFGAGPRNCPGGNFAMHEMKMVLNVLLRRFNFERSIKTIDTNLFQSPSFIFTIFDLPNYIKISPINQ